MINQEGGSNNVTGYLNPGYASSLAEFGTPLELQKCGGWVLKRQIPGTSLYDAMGCYPLFACKDWSKLESDVRELEDKLVSLSIVTDPFADYPLEKLASTFDIYIKFKDHYVTDLAKTPRTYIRDTCRNYAKRALKEISVEHCDNPNHHLLDWMNLYEFLIQRHHITGIRAFSLSSFRRLLEVPGVEMFIARLGDEPIGAELWIVQGNIGYAHLMATSPLGYEHKASYALVWVAIQYFSENLRWLDHGSGSGIDHQEDGLALFKRGWSTETRPVYFGGQILDKSKYKELSMKKGLNRTTYFPAYRVGEFS